MNQKSGPMRRPNSGPIPLGALHWGAVGDCHRFQTSGLPGINCPARLPQVSTNQTLWSGATNTLCGRELAIGCLWRTYAPVTGSRLPMMSLSRSVTQTVTLPVTISSTVIPWTP